MMKRFWSVLLALCMALSLLPVGTLADDGEIRREDGFTYHVNPIYADIVSEDDLLTWEEAKALDAARGIQPDASLMESSPAQTQSEMADYVRAQMRRRVNAIEVKIAFGFSNFNKMMNEVMNEVMLHGKTPEAPKNGDYLLYQYAGYGSSGSGYSNSYTVQISMNYYTTAEQEEQTDAKVEQLKTGLGLTDSGLSNYQKVKIIHDWIKGNVNYDHSFSSGNIMYTAYGACCNGLAVCQGYSVLFYRLAMEAGVDARVISDTGNGGNHAWNMALLDDGWYYLIDCTWDENTNSDKWFLKGRTWFYSAEGDHTPGTSPESGSEHLYYYNSAEFNSVINTLNYSAGNQPDPDPGPEPDPVFRPDPDPEAEPLYGFSGSSTGYCSSPADEAGNVTVEIDDASIDVINHRGNGATLVTAVYIGDQMVKCVMRELSLKDLPKGTERTFDISLNLELTIQENMLNSICYHWFVLDSATFEPLCARY